MQILVLAPTPLPPGSSNSGSVDGSAPDLDGMDVRSSSKGEEKLKDFFFLTCAAPSTHSVDVRSGASRHLDQQLSGWFNNETRRVGTK